MDELTRILGIIGAYFAILLVLAVSIETILEPISWFKGLQKKVSPEDALKDLKAWLPDDPRAAAVANANAIANLTKEYQVQVDDVSARVTAIQGIAADTAKGLGITTQVDELQTKLAVYMAALRARYAVIERHRVTILRSISAVLGIAIAIFLKIDAFTILGDLFPATVQDVFRSSPIAQYGGMVLTGLAASAGSGFWHDQLGKLRAVKEAASRVEELKK